jgi:MFS family permease
MARVMSLRDFRLLFAGAATSLLGDQFTLIATPWLVLQLTNDPLALGTVLALEGIPRAVFMLFGGVLTDSISPRLMMLVANLTRLLLTALMSVAVFTGHAQVWMIYAFGLLFGIVAGFSVPAENSIVPMLVGEQDLQAGNSLIMGVTQLAGFVGPTLAGIIIGHFAGSLMGVAIAYGFDAVTFAVSAVTLQMIRSGQRAASTAEAPRETVWAAILTGVKFVWTDRPIRLMLITLMAVNFLLIGPLLVGIPVLASQRLPEGAAAFGLLMSAYAGGNLLGYLVAGSAPRPKETGMRLILVGFIAAFGLVIASLGFIPYTWVDFGLLFGLGVGNGYLGITLITGMQMQTPKDMLGRIMSLIMLASSGLTPISQAFFGVVIKWNLELSFALPGALILAVTAWLALHPDLKQLSRSMTNAQAL